MTSDHRGRVHLLAGGAGGGDGVLQLAGGRRVPSKTVAAQIDVAQQMYEGGCTRRSCPWMYESFRVSPRVLGFSGALGFSVVSGEPSGSGAARMLVRKPHAEQGQPADASRLK